MTEKLEPQVPQEINDITTDKITALAQLFPSVVKDGQVDFEALQTELLKEPIEFADPKEFYGLTWTGKRESIQLAKEDTTNLTLNYFPEESKNADKTKNLYIEGDNLEVLKLLRQNYYGAVKMIYIDPPYNTGKDFVYKDNFHMTKEEKEESDKAEGIVDEDGERLQVNTKEGNKRYHANWLNMIYPRLKLARELLTEDGVIFISIDDYEVDNLKKSCNEVFGELNFIGQAIRRTINSGKHDVKTIAPFHEYLLIYAKNHNDIKMAQKEKTVEERENLYKLSDEFAPERGKHYITQLNKNSIQYSDSLNYPIEDDVGNIYWAGKGIADKEWCWRWSKDKVEWGRKEGFIVFKNGKVYTKSYELVDNEGKMINRSNPYSTLEFIAKEYANFSATPELSKLFDGNKIFNFPKSESFVREILKLANTKNNDLILDFFSGSATTAHAVMQLNSEDGGTRKFICVQIPEVTDEKSEAYKSGFKNICEIGKERIRRAGEKIKTEVEEANAQLKMGEEAKKVPDIGFKVFKVDDTNIRWNKVEQGDDDMSFEDLTHTPDLADFVMGAKDVDVVYELVLRQRNIPLSLPLQTLTHIGERTYLYGGTLLVCLENELTSELTEKISMLSPLPSKFIFRDSSFGLDIEAKRYTFDLFKKQVDKNTDGTEKDYRVEFI